MLQNIQLQKEKNGGKISNGSVTVYGFLSPNLNTNRTALRWGTEVEIS